jgi:hypothetical protein
MKINWKTIDRLVLISSILASIIALIISIKSCSNSNEALQLSKREFDAKRFLILKSELGNTYPSFEIRTFDQNQKLQKVIAHFPSPFKESEIQIEPPGFYVSLNELQDSLLVFLKRNIPNYKPTSRFEIRSIPIPVIFVSNYVVAGDALKDSSLYNIELDFRQEYFNNSSEMQCEFKNLVYIKRLSDEKDFDRTLSEYWMENFNGSLKNIRQ